MKAIEAARNAAKRTWRKFKDSVTWEASAVAIIKGPPTK